jgi:LacI family transcriptional regulator
MAANVTIADVARRVGVSPSTVSHALSRKRPVSRELRQQIQMAIQEMGYRPHFAARSLVNRKTGMIGLLVSELYNPATGALVEAFEKALFERGYKMLLGLVLGDTARLESYLHEFGSGMVEGVINLDPNFESAQLRRQLVGVPVITYLRPVADTPVHIDRAAGVMQAMEHLWTLGHRQIGLITADPQTRGGAGAGPREMGYRNFYLRQQVAVRPEWIAYGDWRMETGYEHAEGLIRCGCTAIVAGNDLIAIGSIRRARELGLSVPADLSVVGFDDSPMALMVDPPLTTIQKNETDLARWTVEALIDRIVGRPPQQQRVIVPRLIVRGSTAAAPKGRSLDEGKP